MKLTAVYISVRYQTEPKLSLEDYKIIFPEHIRPVFSNPEYAITVSFTEQEDYISLFDSGVALVRSKTYEKSLEILIFALSRIKRGRVFTFLLINHRMKLVVKDILLNILIPMIAKYEQRLLLQMESSGTIEIFTNEKICAVFIENPVTMHLFCEYLREILN